MSAARCTNDRCNAVTMCTSPEHGPRCVECQQRDALILRWHAQAIECERRRRPWWVKLWDAVRP